MPDPIRRCAQCQSPFAGRISRAIYCSRSCNERARDIRRRADPEYRLRRKPYFDQYRDKNRDALVAKSAAWNAANRELHNEMSRRWARENKHSTPQSWRSTHLPEAAAKQRLRIARLREATPVPLVHADVVAKLAYWGDKCWMCGVPATAVDHVKPISRGGLNILANLRPACTSCNSSKRDKWFGPRRLDHFRSQ